MRGLLYIVRRAEKIAHLTNVRCYSFLYSFLTLSILQLPFIIIPFYTFRQAADSFVDGKVQLHLQIILNHRHAIDKLGFVAPAFQGISG